MNSIVERLNARGTLGVLYGGDGAERAVSLASGERVLNALVDAGVNAVGLDLRQNPVDSIVDSGINLALIMLHGSWGEDGRIQSLLELLKIPYSGSGVSASALAYDKHHSKLIWRAAGLNTPDWELIDTLCDFEELALRYCDKALCIKPVSEGSSLGITLLQQGATTAKLRTAWEHAASYGGRVMLEERCAGAEITVGIIGDEILQPLQIIPVGDFYDYAAKYERDDTVYEIPEQLPRDLLVQMREQAQRAYRMLGCTGWGRVDFMLDAQGQAQLIEVNTVPGMTTHSLIPKACAAQQLDYTQCVLSIAADILPAEAVK